MSIDVVLQVLAISIAVFFMIQSGKVVVRSLSVIARYLKLSEYVVSFALIAFATSLPELSVGVNSALLGIPELSFGDIIGTNIVNFSLLLGVTAIIGGSLNLKDYAHFKSNRALQFGAVIAPLLLILDGTLSRIDGIFLISIFVWILIRLFDIDDRILGRKVLRPHMNKHVFDSVTTKTQVIKQTFLLLIAAGFLLTSAIVIINTVKEISSVAGISEAVMGVLLIALITSTPDLIVSIRSVMKDKDGMALGDLLGAATINSTLTLGIVSLISPITLSDPGLVWTGIIFTATTLLLIFFFLRGKHTLSRSEGLALVVVYIIFLTTEISLLIF